MFEGRQQGKPKGAWTACFWALSRLREELLSVEAIFSRIFVVCSQDTSLILGIFSSEDNSSAVLLGLVEVK